MVCDKSVYTRLFLSGVSPILHSSRPTAGVRLINIGPGKNRPLKIVLKFERAGLQQTVLSHFAIWSEYFDIKQCLSIHSGSRRCSASPGTVGSLYWHWTLYLSISSVSWGLTP